MADDVKPVKGNDAESPTVAFRDQTKINADVVFSCDRWVVVSYENEKGELYHGVLLKADNTNEPDTSNKNESAVAAMPFQAADLWRKMKETNPLAWISSNMGRSVVSDAGMVRSPSSECDPAKVSSVVLRRTCANGAIRNDIDFVSINSRPALGIRRLENRSVRLRPTTSQRNTVLCAKCQEQIASSGRRTTTNGIVDRSSNGSSSYSRSSSLVQVLSSKRRSSDAVDSSIVAPSLNNQSSGKKIKTRNGLSISTAAAEAGTSTTAALPSASKVISSSDNSNGTTKANESVESAESETKPKIPKLKISFGNNEGKTTTIINLPPPSAPAPMAKSFPDIKVEQVKTMADEKSIDQSMTFESCGDESYDVSEGALLPGGVRVGDMVWAKMTGSPYWPAKVYNYRNHDGRYTVTWCGSDQYGFVELKAMDPFKEGFQKRYNPTRNNGGYQKAVAEAIVKCSGADDSMDAQSDSVNSNSYYYQNFISDACLRILTGTKSSKRKGRAGNRCQKRNPTAGRRGKSSKVAHQRRQHVDGLDSETSSFSTMSSPLSISAPLTIDWQPRVVIPINEVLAVPVSVVGSKRRKLPADKIWKNSNNTALHTHFVMEERQEPAQETDYYQNGAVSPLPVERSEDDEDEDGFKKLLIDETVRLDGVEEIIDDGDSSSPSCSTISTITIANSVSTPGGPTTYRLISTPATDKAVRIQAAVGDAHGQQSTGNNSRVGEGQDDFESALNELQEMNEMCAAGGTTVSAQC